MLKVNSYLFKGFLKDGISNMNGFLKAMETDGKYSTSATFRNQFTRQLVAFGNSEVLS